MAQKTGVQVVTSAFPMDVHIENKYQKNLPVLYIVDNEAESALAQTLEIKIAQNNTKAYTLKGFGFMSPANPTPATPTSTQTLCPSNSTFKPDSEHFNLAIGVRPGTLRKEVEQNFTNILQKAVTEGFTNQNGVCSNPCVVQGPITRKSDGELIWYVAFANDIQSTGDGVMVSVDVSSNTWNRGVNTFEIVDVVCEPTGQLTAVGSDKRLYTKSSVTSGTWQKLQTLTECISIGFSLQSKTYCFVNSDGKICAGGLTPEASATVTDVDGGVKCLSVLPDDTWIGVDGNNHLVHCPNGSKSWDTVDKSVTILNVAANSDGSLVAAGTDYKLYRRVIIDSSASWVLDESISRPISGVAFDQNDNLMVIGTDNVLYTTEQNWVATPFDDQELNSIEIMSATVHPTTGAVTVIDTSGKFYTKPTLQGGTWQSISPLSSLSLEGKGISVGGDGSYVFVGSNNSVYKGTTNPGDTPTSASMGNTISALLPTNTIILITDANEILYALPGGSYTNTSDPVKVTSIAAKTDGTFVGAGTDNRLYRRKGVEQEYPWQLIPSMTTPIISVGNDANGNILLVGADHLLYRLDEVREVKEISQGNTVSVELQDAVVNAQGEVVAVGTDNLLYTLPILSGSLWQSIETPIPNCVGIGLNISGDFLFVDRSGAVYEGGTATNDSTTSQNISGAVKNISTLSDGTLVGVNLNNELVQCPSDKKSWTSVSESINILSVAVKSDDSLVAAGSDNRLYTRTSISSGPWQLGQELPIPIIGVLLDQHDNLLVIGTDHTLHQPQKNKVAIPYEEDLLGSMEIISAAIDPTTGAITVIDTQNNFHTKSSVQSGTWQTISPLSSFSTKGHFIGVGLDGNYVFIGANDVFYTGTADPGAAPFDVESNTVGAAVLHKGEQIILAKGTAPDGVGVGVCYPKKTGGGWSYMGNPTEILAIAPKADGTFVGVGADNKLYKASSIEHGNHWQLVPSMTTPIISVGNDAEGNTIVVGKDNKLYRISEEDVLAEISGEVQIKDLSISESGEVLGVSTNGGIYTKVSFSEPHWEKLNADWQSDAIAVNPAGGYFVLENGGKVYNATVSLTTGAKAVTLGSAITISNTVTNLSVLSDGTFVGVNGSNQLVQCPKTGGAWTVVTDNTTILSVAVKSDDSLVAAGTDHKLYARKSVSSGQWEEVLVDIEAICGVAVNQSDDLVLIGLDYSLTQVITTKSTAALPSAYTNSISIKDFVVTNSGELVGVSVLGGIYTKVSAQSGSWKKVGIMASPGNPWVAQGICRRPDGSYALLGLDGIPHTITGNTLLGTISNYTVSGGPAIGISTLPDGSFLGVNSSHQPMHCPLNEHSWTVLNNPGGVLSIASFSDGSLVCAGTDHKLYTRSSIANDANWVLYAGFTQEIIGASVDPEDKLWVLGTDHVVYSTEVSPATALVDNQPLNALAIMDMVLDPNSGLVTALDTNKQLYTKTSLQTGNWQPVSPGGPWLSVNMGPNGHYVFTGNDQIGNYGGTSPQDATIQLANKNPILNLAVMADGSYIAINTNNELVHCAATATSWTPITDPVKIQAITVRPEGTLVAAGTDNKLYERAGIATGDLWQPVAGIDIPISNVANDADGNLLVIGTDHNAYEAYLKVASTPVVNQELTSLTIIDITVDPSSGLVTALDSNNLLHTKTSLQTGTWQALSPGGPWNSVSYGSDGKYYFVGTDNIANVGGTSPGDGPQQATNKDLVLNMALMTDGSYIAVNKDNELVHCAATATSWTPIPDATKVLAISVRPDGSLAAAGTDNKLYKRAGITDGDTWQEVKGVNLSIINVANDAEGNLLLISTDHAIYTVHEHLVSPFDDEVLNAMEVISATVHPTTGAVTVIDKDHNFHTKPSWQSSTWKSISPLASLSTNGLSIGVGLDGNYVFVGTNNWVYKGTTDPSDTPSSIDAGNTISATVVHDEGRILVSIEHQLLYAFKGATSWSYASNNTQILAIAAKADGTFVAAGIDNKLYTRKSVESSSQWELVPEMTTPIISVGSDANGNILLVGTDHKVYSYKQSFVVDTIHNEPPLKDLIIAGDGSLTAVGSDNQLYTKTSLSSGNWQPLDTLSECLSVAFWPSESKYIFLNAAGKVCTGGATPEDAATVSNVDGQLQNLSALPSGVWIGVNSDNEFVICPSGTTSWNVVDDSVKIQSVASKPDGILLAAGTDNKLYTRGGSDTTYKWQEVTSLTTPVIGVASDANNTTYVIGPDHAIYTVELAGGSATTALTTDAIDAVIVDAVMNKSGALVGVDAYNNILQKPSVNTGTWTSADVKQTNGNPWLAQSVAQNYVTSGVGTYVLVGQNGKTYTVAGDTIKGQLTEYSISSEINSLSVLPDQGYAGINANNELVHCVKGGTTWTTITDSVKIINVAAKSDGSLVAAGIDNKVYTRPSIDSGSWQEEPSISIPVCGVLVDPSHNDQLVLIGTDNELYEQPTQTITKEEQQYQFLSFTLEKMSAAAGTGPRSTMVELLFGNVLLNKTGKPLSFTIQEQVNITNLQKSGEVPLFFGVLGDGILLNQADTPSELSLYFQTIDGTLIQFSQDAEVPSEIEFTFPYAYNDSSLLNFGTSDEVGAFTLTPSFNYPFQAEGETASTNGGGVLGKNNEKGRVSFKAVFKNLQTVATYLKFDPDDGITSSENLNKLGLSTMDTAIAKENAANDSNITQLLSTLKGIWEGGVSDNDNGLCFYPTLDSEHEYLFQTNADTAINCGFDFLLWNELYDLDAKQTDTSLTDLPSDYILNYNANQPWSNLDFLLFVIQNYVKLASKAYVSIKPGNAYDHPSESCIYETSWLNSPTHILNVRVCQCTYAFFEAEYQKNRTLASYSQKVSATNAGAQAAAQIGVFAEQESIRQKSYSKCEQLARFLTTNDGPYEQLCAALGIQSKDDLYNNTALPCSKDVLTVNIANYTGDAPIGSPGFQNFKKFDGKISNTSWDVLPSGMVSEYLDSSLWNNSNFTTHFSNQINTIAAALLAFNEDAVIKTSKSGVYGLIPCKAVFEFVKALFELEQTLSAYKPGFLLDVSDAFSVSAWANAADAAKEILPDGTAILSQSAIGNSSQSFADADFLTYVKANFKSLCQTLGTYSFTPEGTTTATEYVLPCQSLYDYLWSNYLKVNPDKIPNSPSQTALSQAGNYVFNFSDLKVSGENGVAMVGVTARNFPGYRDTSFQVPVRKSDTTTNSTVRIGASDTPGRGYILPNDPNYNNSQGAVYGSRIDFMTGGDNGGAATVNIEEHYGLNIYGSLPTSDPTVSAGLPTTKGDYSKTGQPVRVRQADLLIEDGRLGIGNMAAGMLSGDFTVADESQNGALSHKLRVEGDSYLNGNTVLSGDLRVDGLTSLKGNATVDGTLTVQEKVTVAKDLQVGGTISDQYGPLVPPGTIRMMSLAHHNSFSPPDGWLNCDGSNLTTLLVNDLNAGYKKAPNYVSKYWPLYQFLAQGMLLQDENGEWTIPFANVSIQPDLNGDPVFVGSVPGPNGPTSIGNNSISQYKIYLPQFSSQSNLYPSFVDANGPTQAQEAMADNFSYLNGALEAISSGDIDGGIPMPSWALSYQQVVDTVKTAVTNQFQFIIKY